MRGLLYLIFILMLVSTASALPKIYVTISEFPSTIAVNGTTDFKVTVENLGDAQARNITGSFSYSPKYTINKYITIDSLAAGEGVTETYKISAVDLAIVESLDITVERYFDTSGNGYFPYRGNYWANNPEIDFSISESTSTDKRISTDNAEWALNNQKDAPKIPVTVAGSQGGPEDLPADLPQDIPDETDEMIDPEDVPWQDNQGAQDVNGLDENQDDTTAGSEESLTEVMASKAIPKDDDAARIDPEEDKDLSVNAAQSDGPRPDVFVGILILSGFVIMAGVVIFIIMRRR